MATAQAGGDAGHGPGAPEPDDPVPPGVAGIEPGLPRAALGAGLGLLAEGASDVVYLVRSDGIVEWVSPSVTRVLGWQPADLVGSRPWFVVHADDRERAATLLAESIRSGEPPVGFELRMLTRDGRSRWMHASGHTVRIGQDIDGFVVGLRDIDDLVRARTEELADRARRQATLHALLDPHLLLAPERDENGQVVDFRCEDANDAACESLAQRRSDVEGERLSTLMGGDAWIGFLARLAEVVESGQPLVRDGAPFRRRRDGQQRLYDIRAIRAGTSVSLIWRDVTERALAAHEPERSERRFRLAMAHAGIGMSLAGRDGMFLAVNAALCTFLGRSEDQLLSSTWQELTHPDDLESDLALAQALVAGEREDYRLGKRFLRPDGSVAHGDLTVTAVRDDGGEVEYFIAQVVDVGEQVALRAQLDRIERKFRLALGSAPNGMAVVGLDRRFLEVNPALCERLGRDPGWLLARGLPDVVHPEDQRGDLALHARACEGPDGRTRQAKRLLRADGSALWVVHAIGLLRDDAGRPVSFVEHFLDTAEMPPTESGLLSPAIHDEIDAPAGAAVTGPAGE